MWTLISISSLFFLYICLSHYSYYVQSVRDTIGEWHNNLAEFIRFNDISLLDSANKVLGVYQSDVVPCASVAEFCDVASLHDVISGGDADAWLQSVLDQLP